MDADLSDRLTAGAAFTANYCDLTASAADSADAVSYTHLWIMLIMPERSFWGVERFKWGMMPR